MHGWIILDKPLGLGSTQAVSAVKRALRTGGYGKYKVGHGAGAKKLVLFHHEPTSSDADIERLFAETIRYEALTRRDSPPLEIVCSYDSLELEV